MTNPLPMVGIGLRQPHYREVFERLPDLGFVEVHSENFFLDGGASMQALDRARAAYPVSLHGVGLSLGSADALAERHLAKLHRLAERIEPSFVSEHLCWGGIGGLHFNDLLPLPYTAEAVDVLAAQVREAQDFLGRQLLIENVSAYVAFDHSTLTEWEFLSSLVERTGCGLLLDLNNVYVSSRNLGIDAHAFIDGVPAAAVGEIHLAGHAVRDGVLIDDHGSRVCDDVWTLYRHTIARLGARPTLIEWDTDVPPLETLLAEAAHADRIVGEVHGLAA